MNPVYKILVIREANCYMFEFKDKACAMEAVSFFRAHTCIVTWLMDVE